MISLEPNKYYHLYNRGNNREKLFYTSENYKYFLTKYRQHCFHIFETYAYCLMSNHFHLLVSVRTPGEQQRLYESRSLKTKKLRSPSKHLANFFSSYTQSINKQEGRVGSLFQKNFKRKVIDSEEYFRRLVIYIHQNPVNHRFVKDLYEYPYSSFHSYVKRRESFINTEKVLETFGGLENFEAVHQEKVDLDLE